MKKIAFLSIYNGLVERGAEVFISELAERLSYEFTVSLFQGGPPAKQSFKVIQIKIPKVIPTDVSGRFFLKILKKFFLDPYNLLVFYFSLRLIPFLLQEKFDFIVPVNGFWQVLIVKLVRFFKGSKILIHGLSGPGPDDLLNVKLGPDVFMPMAKSGADWAQKINSSLKIEVLNGGVDLKEFNPNIKPANIPLKKPIVVCASAFVPYKRVDLVIKTLSKIKNVSFLLIGDGPQKEYLTSLINKLLKKERYLIKKVAHEKMASYYRASDLFTLPSEPREAFGIVYVEAMACGLPVVAPLDSLRQEIVGEAGILTNVEDENEYSNAIQEALSKNWGDLPQKQAQKFSWDHISQKYGKILKSL